MWNSGINLPKWKQETNNTYYGEEWELYIQQSKNSQELNTEIYFIGNNGVQKVEETKPKSKLCSVNRNKVYVILDKK